MLFLLLIILVLVLRLLKLNILDVVYLINLTLVIAAIEVFLFGITLEFLLILLNNLSLENFRLLHLLLMLISYPWMLQALLRRHTLLGIKL